MFLKFIISGLLHGSLQIETLCFRKPYLLCVFNDTHSYIFLNVLGWRLDLIELAEWH